MSNALTTYAMGSTGELKTVRSGQRVVDPSLPVCAGLAAPYRAHRPMLGGDVPSCSKAAEVVVTPDGASLFASNRGFGSPLTNTIAGERVISS